MQCKLQITQDTFIVKIRFSIPAFIFKLAGFLKTAAGKKKALAFFVQDTRALCISTVSVMGKSTPYRFSP